MTSRWLVATAVLGGLLAAVALGFFSAVFASIWLYSGDYGSHNPFFRIFLGPLHATNGACRGAAGQKGVAPAARVRCWPADRLGGDGYFGRDDIPDPLIHDICRRWRCCVG